MTDTKIFGIAGRVIGLWLAAYYGLVDIFAAIATAADQRMTEGYSAEHRLLVGVFTLIMGVALLKGEWLVRFVYAKPQTEQNST